MILEPLISLCQKVHLSAFSALGQQLGVSVYGCTIAESGNWHSALLRRGNSSYFPGLPPLVDAVEVLGQGRGRASKAHSARFCSRYVLGLTLAYVHALVLRDEAQHL